MWFGHVQALPDRLVFWDRDVFTVTENRRDRLLSVRGADTVSLVESKPAEARGVRGPCNSSPREYIARHGYFPKPQAVHAVTLHPNGALWVQHGDLSGNSRIVVFDSTAAPLGVLAAEFPMPIAFMPDGRTLIQVVDSVDVERIGILDVIPGEG